MTKKFYAKNLGFLLGQHFNAGDEVLFSHKQCIALSWPNGDDLTSVKPGVAVKKATSKASTDKSGK